jgi:HD-like signal output (HDOD) protein
MAGSSSSGGGRWSYRMSQDRRLSDLPVLPTTLVRLLALDVHSTGFFDQLTQIVEGEPGLALRLVALANSAAYARGKSVCRVREAAIRAGAEAAVDLVLNVSVARVFVPRRPWESALWVHAVRVACFTRCLALVSEHPDIDPDTAYLAGLLHELGRFVLLQEAPWVLRQFVEDEIPRELRMKAERVMIGIDHQALGADAAARWGMPTVLVSAILRYNQHDVDDALPLAALVRTADRLDATDGDLSDEFEERVVIERLRGAVPAWMPVPPERLAGLVRQASLDARARLQILLPHLFTEPLALAG